MDPRQLERYSRHILLPEFDIAGQERLSRAAVLIVGAGGLGSPAAMYLASSGVGHLILNDDDVVDLGNLQRQILHGAADIGRLKVDSARDRLRTLNPEVRVTAIPRRLDGQGLEREVRGVQLVLDCSDNFPTRHALNAACVRARVPLIWGAAIQLQGQVTTFDHRRADSPCLACLYPDQPETDAGDCAASGVLAPTAGIVGCIMAAEALKLLVGIGDTLCGRVLLLDIAAMEPRQIRLQRDPGCAVCGRAASAHGSPAVSGGRL